MNRTGFLLGFLSTGTQVLLLRALVSSLNGTELFLGTALFGWLLWVALGALLGGRRPGHVSLLFIAGSILLPLSVIAVRLAPLVVTDVPGQFMPFSTAAALSIVLMLPCGLVSGWLFPAIAGRRGWADETVVTVYLFEGIGAFAAGIAVLVGSAVLQSTTAVAILTATVVLVLLPVVASREASRRLHIVAVLLAVIIGSAAGYSGPLDRFLTSNVYPGFDVVESFDTHYAHHDLLRRDGSMILMTDCSVESVFPDRRQAEMTLVPPLLYAPRSSQMLVTGRYPALGPELVDSLAAVTVTVADPRWRLADRLSKYHVLPGNIMQLNRDPLKMLRRRRIGGQFNVIVVQPGHLDSYRAGRLLSVDNLILLRSAVSDSGLVMIELPFDTDRYVTDGDARVLRVVTASMQAAFPEVAIWPGETTLLFGGSVPRLAVPVDRLIDRVSRLPFSPLYVTAINLRDRLDGWKVQRLGEALSVPSAPNTLDRPLLPYVQAWHRAQRSSVDRFLVTNLLDRPAWLFLLPLAVLAVFGRLLRDSDRRRRFGLLLYAIAGAISLSLELTSFYVYQSMAGSLYSELAILVGSFMLGLALGTYITYRSRSGVSAQFGIGLILLSTVVFALTYDAIVPRALLIYHALFLLAAAMGTGAVFVGATRRYYQERSYANRGIGYGAELAGSAVGALVSTTLVLPIVGLAALLWSLVGLLVLGIVGCVLTSRGRA